MFGLNADWKTILMVFGVFLGNALEKAHASQSNSNVVFESELSQSVTESAPAKTLSLAKDTPKDQLPFWKGKKALLERMRDQRAIFVSVKSEKVSRDPELIRFSMQGAGWVSRNKETSFRVAQQFSKLKDVSSHFKTVQYNPTQQQLFLITEALGYQARMILDIRPVEEDWRSELQWKVVWGHFKGMTGVIGFEKAEEDKTEVSLTARYEAKELPLPKILVGFALEVVTQKVAEKMRSFIETQNIISESPARGAKGLGKPGRALTPDDQH